MGYGVHKVTVQTPRATAAPVLAFAPPQPGGGGFHLLNAGYAVQWNAFALFAIYVWVRMVRDEYAVMQAAQQASGSGADNEDSDDSGDDPNVGINELV